MQTITTAYTKNRTDPPTGHCFVPVEGAPECTPELLGALERGGAGPTAFDQFVGSLWSYWRQADGDYGSFLDTAALELAGIELGDTPWPLGVGWQNRIPGENPTRRVDPSGAILGETGWRVDLIDGDNSPARHFFAFFAIASTNGTAAAVFGLEDNEAAGLQGSSLQDLNSGYAAIALAALWTGLDTPLTSQQFGAFVGDVIAVGGDASRTEPLQTNFDDTAIPVSRRPGDGEFILRQQQAFLFDRHPAVFGQ